MDLSDVKKIYNNYKPKNIENPKPASVLIPLIEENKRTYVIFEKRSSTVSQPGDISFAGGHVEKGESPRAASIREATEELNIKPENISLISEADYLITHSNMIVNSFVGEITGLKFDDIKPNNEVEYLIKLPLDELVKSEKQVYTTEFDAQRPDNFPYHLIHGQRNYKFAKVKEQTYFYELHGVTVWGFTAKVLSAFLENLKHNP